MTAIGSDRLTTASDLMPTNSVIIRCMRRTLYSPATCLPSIIEPRGPAVIDLIRNSSFQPSRPQWHDQAVQLSWALISIYQTVNTCTDEFIASKFIMNATRAEHEYNIHWRYATLVSVQSSSKSILTRSSFAQSSGPNFCACKSITSVCVISSSMVC